jgi:hypothetical protein
MSVPVRVVRGSQDGGGVVRVVVIGIDSDGTCVYPVPASGIYYGG